MDIKLINIGFGNIVSANRIVAIVSPESAPIKRIIQEARDRVLTAIRESGYSIKLSKIIINPVKMVAHKIFFCAKGLP